MVEVCIFFYSRHCDCYHASNLLLLLLVTHLYLFVAMTMLLKDPEPDVRRRAAEAVSHLLNI